MDYEALSNLPGVTHYFETERGSKYAHHDNTTTTRNRSGANHTDKTEGIQPRSGKTVYMSPTATTNIAGIFQNPEMGTKFVPIMDAEGKPTGKAGLYLMEDFGPKKAGTLLGTAPYETKPSVGLNPVEIYKSESPKGDSGRGIHFGNKITSVTPKSGGGGGGGGISPVNPLMGSGLTPFGIKQGGFIDKPIQGGNKTI
jgi:hypothetical protein